MSIGLSESLVGDGKKFCMNGIGIDPRQKIYYYFVGLDGQKWWRHVVVGQACNSSMESSFPENKNIMSLFAP